MSKGEWGGKVRAGSGGDTRRGSSDVVGGDEDWT